MRRRALICCALAALAAPAGAAAHGRSPTIALDYQVRLAATAPGVHVEVLDGDRALQLSVAAPHEVVVHGLLREAVLRVGPDGVWVNQASPTAAADRLLVPHRSGWVRVSSGHSIAWHEHKLSPPPARRAGLAGTFTVPITVDGRAASIAGTFWRVPRPAAWPWALGASLFAVLVAAAAVFRRRWRSRLTVTLGTAAGLGALLAITTFAARDAPNGQIAWVQIVSGVVVGAVLAAVLLVLRDQRRVHAAGVVGGIAAAASIGSLPVFWHGVVISALSGTSVRLACGLALVGGASAAALSFLPEFDGGRR